MTRKCQVTSLGCLIMDLCGSRRIVLSLFISLCVCSSQSLPFPERASLKHSHQSTLFCCDKIVFRLLSFRKAVYPLTAYIKHPHARHTSLRKLDVFIKALLKQVYTFVFSHTVFLYQSLQYLD